MEEEKQHNGWFLQLLMARSSSISTRHVSGGGVKFIITMGPASWSTLNRMDLIAARRVQCHYLNLIVITFWRREKNHNDNSFVDKCLHPQGINDLNPDLQKFKMVFASPAHIILSLSLYQVIFYCPNITFPACLIAINLHLEA